MIKGYTDRTISHHGAQCKSTHGAPLGWLWAFHGIPTPAFGLQQFLVCPANTWSYDELWWAVTAMSTGLLPRHRLPGLLVLLHWKDIPSANKMATKWQQINNEPKQEKNPTKNYIKCALLAQYCHTELPTQRWCHSMPLHSGTDSSDWVWILQEIFTLAPSMHKQIHSRHPLGNAWYPLILNHPTFAQLVSFASCCTSQISISNSFFDQEPSELKCLEENSPDVANFFGKAPDTWTRTRGGFLPGASRNSGDMTRCDMMWHYATSLCCLWWQSWPWTGMAHVAGLKREKIPELQPRASSIWRMMELFLQRGPKRLQFAARHGKTEAIWSQ